MMNVSSGEPRCRAEVFQGDHGAGWTFSLTKGEVLGGDSDSATFSQDSEGVLNFEDGSQIEFSQIERIQLS